MKNNLFWPALASLAVLACAPVSTSDGGDTPDAISVADAGEDAAQSQPDVVLPNNDAGDPEDDAGVQAGPTLADYRVCVRNSDCPFGECLKQLQTSRGNGTLGESVDLSDTFDLQSDQGICTVNCVVDPSVCGELNFRNASGVDVPFVCQVVTVGESPYPTTPPAFPFDDELDLDAMAQPVDFVAMCRPPFELDPAHDDQFCGACTSDEGCDTGFCLDLATGAEVAGEASGICVEEMSDACPLGFGSRSVEGSDYCVPTTDTCGACQDRDGDGFGVGHCARESVDCDDRERNAYFDPDDLNHAFPAHCGEQDFNCNGLSDDTEQVGNPEIVDESGGVAHCEFCFDDADGDTVQAGTDNEAVLACIGGSIGVGTCANSNFLSCSSEPRVNGCDTQASAGGVVYFADLDADGFGDPNLSSPGCPSGAPFGFVEDNTDCNDDDFDIKPGVPDQCDCWGDCADDNARIDNDCDGQKDEDATLYSWFTDDDLDGAGNVLIPGTTCGAPEPGAVPSTNATPTDCAGGSASAGAHVRISDDNGLVALPVLVEPQRDANGDLILTSVAALDEVCDGIDNNCAGGLDDGLPSQTYFRDNDDDGFGDINTAAQFCSEAVANLLGFVDDTQDCADDDFLRKPGVPEDCDGIDQDCDGQSDDDDEIAFADPACTAAGVQGLCTAGQKICVAGGEQCAQVVFPEQFDDPATPEDENCQDDVVIFVNGVGGSDNNLGATMPQGLRTIPAALARAESIGANQLHILSGNYAITDTITLVDGIDLVGGFDDSGAFTGASTSIMKAAGAVNDDSIVIKGEGVTMSLAYLELANQAPAVADRSTTSGPASVGLRLIDSTVVLKNVRISADDGVDGAHGAGGANGTSGVGSPFPSTNISPCGAHGGASDLFNSSAGSGNFPGGGRTGTGTPENGFPAPRNSPPAGLSPSGVRRTFASGDRLTFFISQALAGTAGNSGGGGGGAVSGVVPNSNPPEIILSTAGASGGCGGGGGGFGKQGGSSIALMTTNSVLSFINVELNAGDGGDGGNAGRGGNGGNGTTGAAPNDPQGATGGQSSGGTGGGAGAAGNGGYSYGWFNQGQSDVCAQADITEVTFETLGVPGSGGNAGNSGLGGAHGIPDRGPAANGGSTPAGVAGIARGCFHSASCTQNDECVSANAYCEEGNCYERGN